jgi:hypothetical protein
VGDLPSPVPSKIRVARLHDALRKYSTGRTKHCRRKRIAPSVQIQRTPDGAIKMQGVCTCGSPWGCPSCAVKIYTERSAQVTSAATQWRDSGGFLYLMTNTLRHAWDDDLRVLRTHLSKATSRMWQGRAGQSLMARIQKKHHIRSIEVTHGENGYHPHVHMLLFMDRELQDSDKQEFADRWKQSVDLELGSRYVPDDEHGTTIDESHRTDYITKLGLEVAAITTKLAKNGNRMMWTVAADAADGDKQSGAIWARYVRDMFGCRQLFWSKGAKREFGIKQVSDADIAAESIETGEPLGVASVLVQWQGLSWDAQARRNPLWLTQVVTKALEGPAAMATLPGQDESTPEGHIPIKREPLHPVAWRRDTSKDALELPESDWQSRASPEREKWRKHCLTIGLDPDNPPEHYRDVASVPGYGPEYLGRLFDSAVGSA